MWKMGIALTSCLRQEPGSYAQFFPFPLLPSLMVTKCHHFHLQNVSKPHCLLHAHRLSAGPSHLVWTTAMLAFKNDRFLPILPTAVSSALRTLLDTQKEGFSKYLLTTLEKPLKWSTFTSFHFSPMALWFLS